jgi:hypothetical protein
MRPYLAQSDYLSCQDALSPASRSSSTSTISAAAAPQHEYHNYGSPPFTQPFPHYTSSSSFGDFEGSQTHQEPLSDIKNTLRPVDVSKGISEESNNEEEVEEEESTRKYSVEDLTKIAQATVNLGTFKTPYGKKTDAWKTVLEHLQKNNFRHKAATWRTIKSKAEALIEYHKVSFN